MELIKRLRQSIRDETGTPEGGRQQRDALRQLRRTLDTMPTAQHGDGLTNHDHDHILYTR